MPVQDLTKFQRKRLDPVKGLVVDVPVWTDSHNYHRDQQRLHAFSAHKHGIVTGLEVVAWHPPDNSLVIYPGVAIDPEGNAIVVSQAQRFYVKTEEKGTSRIIIRYSEIPPDKSAKTGEGQPKPLYVTEAFRIEEQRQRSAEPQVELARITINDATKTIRNPDDPYAPLGNEIDTRFRTVAAGKPDGEISLGILSYPAGRPTAGWDSHRKGTICLVQSIQRSTGYGVRLVDGVDLSGEITDCEILYMTGSQDFRLSDIEVKVLDNHLKRGGTLLGEGCSAVGATSADSDKRFRSSFAALCEQLGRPLRSIQRQHPVFRSYHVFGTLPAGQCDPPLVMENDGILYSEADYGCAWEGGRSEKPLARGTIRDTLEFGINVALHSHQRARFQAIKLV